MELNLSSEDAAFRDEVRAFINATPTERVDLQFGVDYKFDDYHASQYGLQNAKGWQVNFDANVRATDTVSTHAFVSYEKYATEQRSIALGGTQANVTNTGLDWSAMPASPLGPDIELLT